MSTLRSTKNVLPPLPRRIWWPWDEPARRVGFYRAFDVPRPARGTLYLSASGPFGVWLDDRWMPVPDDPLPPWRAMRRFAVELSAGRHALNVLAVSAACSLLVALQYLLVFFPLFLLLMVPIYGVVVLYAIQFYWAVLKHTANDEDVIPWAQTDWSFWYDGFKPLTWMIIISFLCTLPALVLRWLAPPPLNSDPAAFAIALAAGWFFWPVAVMSVALGNTILFVRPDWLVRCVIGIGPVYLVAWMAVLLAVIGWVLFLQFWQYWIWIPVLGFAVNLYFGYIVFRTLGLLFRHFRARFPWQF